METFPSEQDETNVKRYYSCVFKYIFCPCALICVALLRVTHVNDQGGAMASSISIVLVV